MTRPPSLAATLVAQQLGPLTAGAPASEIERALGQFSEFIAIVPASMRIAVVLEARALATAKLEEIGYENAAEIVEAAITRAIESAAATAAREAAVEKREKELEVKEMHRGVHRARALVSLAATMRRGDANQKTIRAALGEENHRCDPPLSSIELDDITAHVCRFRAAELPKTKDLVGEVKKALEGPPPVPTDEDLPNFRVTKVLALNSDPPSYWLTIDEVPYRWSAEELSSVSRFKLRFMKACRRVPLRLPKKPEQWDELVDSWLRTAETVEQPPDSSPEIFMRDHLTRAVFGLPIGDEIQDLEDGKAIEHEDRLAFKLVAALRLAKDVDHTIGTHEVAEHLRFCGFENKVIWVAGKSVRVWVTTPRPVEPVPGPNGSSEAGTPPDDAAMAAAPSVDVGDLATEYPPIPTENDTEEADDLPF